MLEGNKPDPRYPLPEEVRDWQLAKTFGWTYQQIQEQPAVWLDWILQVDATATEVQNEKAAKG